MSKLANAVVVARESFVRTLFSREEPFSVADANTTLAAQDIFGLNKKMAPKRIYEIRAEVFAARDAAKVASAGVVVAEAAPVTPLPTVDAAPAPEPMIEAPLVTAPAPEQMSLAV